MDTTPRRALLKAIAGVASLSGCLERSAGTPTKSRDGTEQATPGPRTDSPAPKTTERPSGEPVWTHDTDGEIPRPPVAANDSVYARVEDVDDSPNEYLCTVDAREGTRRWRLETAFSDATGSPITVRDALYFVQRSSSFAGISGSSALAVEFSGEKRWTFAPEELGVMQQYGFDDATRTLLVGTHGGNAGKGNPLMLAVDASTGRERWRKKLGGTDVRFRDGQGFVQGWERDADGDLTPVVRSFDVGDGTFRWSVSRKGHFVGLAGASVVLVSGLGDPPYLVYGLDAAGGSEMWSFELPIGTADEFGGAIMVGNTVYVRFGNRLVALDPATGNRRWRSPALDASVGQLQRATEDRLYTYDGIRGRTIYAFDTSDGTHRWSWADGARIVGALPHGDVVYVYGLSHLQALDAVGGDPLWRFEPGAKVSAPAVSGQRVFVGDRRGTLYAFEHRKST